MRIFLVRHADADAEVPEGLGDEARALTAKGRAAVLAHFQSLAPRLTDIHLVITSPLVRCVQTAQILSSVLHHEGSLKAHRALLPDMPVGAVESVIQSQAGQNLVLVGHQPTLGAMTAHLLGIPALLKPVHPGTVIALERPDDSAGHASLLFYAAPGQPLLETL